MGRIFILAIIGITQIGNAQNILLNGDFEVTIANTGNYHIFVDSFYAKYWIIPSDCTPDIYRAIDNCDSASIKAYEPQLQFCIPVHSGNYCAGLSLLNEYGAMEHLTGKLAKPMIKDHYYKVSFWLKYIGGKDNFISKGFGYVFSNDSIVFKSNQYDINGLKPYYQTLFNQNCVFADFSIGYFEDTTWTLFESLYKSTGNEQFVTFGRFCLEGENGIKDQLSAISKKPAKEKLKKKLSKSTFIKTTDTYNDYPVLNNYFFIDDVVINEVDEEINEAFLRQCDNCVDNNPLTINIPSSLEINVDKRMVGEINVTVNGFLSEMEKLTIELPQNKKFIFVNTDNAIKQYQYQFKYPAKKLRNKNIKYSVQPISKIEVSSISNSFRLVKVTIDNRTESLFTNLK